MGDLPDVQNGSQDRATMDRLEERKHLTPSGVEYWRAREIHEVLGYPQWREFGGVIDRAMKACSADGREPTNHFVVTSNMVAVGSGTKRQVDDYFLSRGAAYLIAMNGNPRLPQIAAAQRYFAAQTRRMEERDEADAQLAQHRRRLDLRSRVKDRNAKLGKAAHDAGVRRFDIFHGAGIRAMYNMRLGEIKARRGLAPKEDWLDRQGIEELAANEFRVTQAEAKIRRERIVGEQRAIDAHAAAGRETRHAIGRMGNTMPEDLPVEPPTKEIEAHVRAEERRLSRPK